MPDARRPVLSFFRRRGRALCFYTDNNNDSGDNHQGGDN
jgi:hypothetical protein